MKTVTFDSPQKALILSLVLLFFLAASVVLMFWTGQRALASFWQTRAFGNELKINKRANYMYKAAGAERRDDEVWRNLSQVLLAQAVNIARQKPSEDKSKNQQELQRLGQVSKNAIFAARNAKDLDKHDPANWENLGDIFSNLIPYAQGSAEQAVSAYEKALKRDPQNPSLHLKKARAKYALAQRLSRQISQLQKAGQQNRQAAAQAKKQIDGLNKQVDKLLKEAEEFAKKSVELKPDYASAYMFLTDLYERQGKMDEAIAQISNVVLMNPQNAGLYFQLGLLHFKKDDMARAQAAFQQAANITSEYANARYFLGLSYARQQKRQKAIEQFEKVAELNEDNKQVKKIISNLKAGKKPLAGIVEEAKQPVQAEEAPVKEPSSQAVPRQGGQVPQGGLQQPQGQSQQ